jgi:hypothetical protein
MIVPDIDFIFWACLVSTNFDIYLFIRSCSINKIVWQICCSNSMLQWSSIKSKETNSERYHLRYAYIYISLRNDHLCFEKKTNEHRHDVTEILLKVALSTIKDQVNTINKSQDFNMLHFGLTMSWLIGDKCT